MTAPRYYQELWEAKKQVLDPSKLNWLSRLLHRIRNLWRAPPVCLNCGKEMGYWRSGEPTCYKCDLI